MEKDCPFSKEVFTKIIYSENNDAYSESIKGVATINTYSSIISNAISSINKYATDNQNTTDYPFFKVSQTIKFQSYLLIVIF